MKVVSSSYVRSPGENMVLGFVDESSRSRISISFTQEDAEGLAYYVTQLLAKAEPARWKGLSLDIQREYELGRRKAAGR